MTRPVRPTPVRAPVLATLLAVSVPAAAFAGDAGVIRTGNHPGFGRIVFEFASPTTYNMAVDGDRVIVVFDGAPVIAQAGAVPRNVRLIQGGQGAATLLLSPGARARPAAMGNRVVIDVLDPPRTGAAQPAQPAQPAQSAGPAQVPELPGVDGAPAAQDAQARQDAPSSGTRPPQGTQPARAARVQGVRMVPFRPLPPVSAATPPGAAPATPVQQETLPDPARPAGTSPAQAAPVQPPAQGPHGPGLAAPGTDAAMAAAAGPAPHADAATSSAPTGAGAGPPSPAASLLIPAEAGIGAAALQRGDVVLIVLDSPTEVDEARLHGLAGATVQTGPMSTVVQVPAPPGRISLTREARGWRISVAPPQAALPGQPTAAVDAAQPGADMLLRLPQPGRVVTVADPSTGGALLMGTVNPASGPAAGLAMGTNAPGAAILPTLAGVAVEPFSDGVVLRPAAGGFVLAAAQSSRQAPGAPAASAALLTRRFDLPDQPVPALLQRLRAAAAGAAAAPPRARTPGRIATAQAMLALGLAAEAWSVLSLAASDDPAAAASPDIAGLTAIAALLAGRVDAAGGLDAPGLDGSDEVALWRGVRDAMLGRGEQAARSLPPLMPLVLAYPAPLRDRILPLVAETAVLAGHPAAASLPDLPRLGFARALQLELRGDTDAALAALDALAASPDQLDQMRAGARAAELRLAAGRITPAQAAAALTRLVATWRGDAREAAARMRAAELHAAAGAWRPALDLLRETEGLFPDAQPAIRARMAAVFSAFLARGDGLPPLEVVTLAADYADCIPADAPAGADLAGLLTGKLLDLDLPARARALLEQRVAAAPPGPVRAGLGHRLALLQAEAGEAAAAGRTLAATDAAGLPVRLMEERALLRAKSRAALGDPAGAAAGLSSIASPAADDLRARLLAQAGNWPGALAALDGLAARVLPPDGPIPDAQVDIVMRQASAAVQAGDAAALRVLNGRYAARLSGPNGDVFRLLTAAPVGGVGDLPRAVGEIALARAVPGGADPR